MNHDVVMMKWAAAFSVLIFLFNLWQVVRAGLSLRRESSHLNPALYEAVLLHKKFLVFGSFLSLLMSVALIEVMVRIADEDQRFPVLFRYHLAFAVSFVLLFLALVAVNGQRSPRWHRRLQRMFYADGFLMATSGFYLWLYVGT